MDTSRVMCRHCGHNGYQNVFGHERVCGENPDNLPDLTVRHPCGHDGFHKPFDSSADGLMKRRRMEEGRPCSDCVVRAYTKAQQNRTPEQIAEQRAEARAAFGPGETIMNVITGERYTS